MKKEINITIFIIALSMSILLTIPVYSMEQSHKGTNQAGGWSSLDYVFYKQEQDLMVKKPGSGPIKIGFTVREVQEVMGVPDLIDEEGYTFYYHHSPIYFGTDWRVRSWDNRYGNLKVLPEVEEIKLGYHIWKVFQEKGFPLRIKKENNSYLLEYVDQLIYLNEMWLVEAIQTKDITEYEQNRANMDMEKYLQEFELFLKD